MVDVRFLAPDKVARIRQVFQDSGADVEVLKGLGFKVRYEKYPRFCIVSFDPQRGFHLKVSAAGGLSLEEAQACLDEIGAGLDLLSALFAVAPEVVDHNPELTKNSQSGLDEDQESDKKSKFEVGLFRVMCGSTLCVEPCSLATFMLKNRAFGSYEYRLGPKHCGSPGWSTRKKWVEKKEGDQWVVLDDSSGQRSA